MAETASGIVQESDPLHRVQEEKPSGTEAQAGSEAQKASSFHGIDSGQKRRGIQGFPLLSAEFGDPCVTAEVTSMNSVPSLSQPKAYISYKTGIADALLDL